MYFYLLCVLVIGVVLNTADVQAKTGSDVYEGVYKSIVIVENIDSKGHVESMGSGVVFSSGVVVTNCHVVKEASRIRVRSSNQNLTATLQFSDGDRDVCSVVTPDLFAPPVVVGSTKKLKVGSKVYAVGAPKGLKLTISDGIVSSLREVDGGHYIQTTAAISPGSSGGGLFDENGELIGLTTFYLSEGQNLNFAIPVEWVNELHRRGSQKPAGLESMLQWINKAIDLENRKDWLALLQHSRRWADVHADNEWAWFNLGRAYSEIGKIEGAIEAYQQALRVNQKNSNTWFNLGGVYNDSEEFEKSIEAYRQAIVFNPEFANAWNNLGSMYSKLGRIDSAIGAYREAIKIRPDNANSWYNLGNLYGKNKQHEKAVDAYLTSVEINPGMASAWINLGNAFYRSGQLSEAVLAYNRGLQISPDHANSWYSLGVVYWKLGQRDKVLDSYGRLKILSPARAEQFFKLYVMP